MWVQNFIRWLAYALLPLLVLLAAASAACVIGYFIVHGLELQYPLRKMISKVTEVLLVLSIFPLMARLKFANNDIGLASISVFGKQFGLGFGLGMLTLLPVILLLYGIGVNIIDTSQTWTIGSFLAKLLLSLAAAILIALLEEPLFRGLLLSQLTTKMPLTLAILISSVYYAGLHFLKTDTDLPLSEISVVSGFPLMLEAFANLLNPQIQSALWSLVTVGIFLGVLRSQFNTGLGWCVGCHASWVWQIKLSKSLFNTDPASPYHAWVSSYDGIIGPLVTLWLGAAVILFLSWRSYRRYTG